MRKNEWWICKTPAGDHLVTTINKNRRLATEDCARWYGWGYVDESVQMWKTMKKAGWSCVKVTLEEVK